MTDYFSHDYNARRDPKLVAVRMRLGYEGIGIYWSLIEYLYEQGGYLLISQCDCIADELRTHSEKINTLIFDFELFENDGVKFWSPTAINRLKIRAEKSEKASNSAKKRWNYANAMRTQCDGNAIKESKGKEIKVNKRKKIKLNTSVAISWKSNCESFEKYQKWELEEYEKIINDQEWLKERDEFHRNINVIMTLKKAHIDFWSKPAGWNNIKKRRCENVDWKSTWSNALTFKCNQVWKNKTENTGQSNREKQADRQYKENSYPLPIFKI